MARYRGTLKGQRPGETAIGSKQSGLAAEINGWDIGVKVKIGAYGDTDVVIIYLTGGSNGSTHDKYLGAFKRVGDDFEPYE